MKKLVVFLALLLLAPAFAPAQETPAEEAPFNGLILDDAGKGVRAKVMVKHRNKRTVANKAGKFGLTNIQPTDTLIIEYRGQTAEIALQGMRSLKVLWMEDQTPAIEESEELVDYGYGYIKRRDYTDASSGLTGEEMRRRGYTDLQTAILNMVPGIQLVNGELTIRGTSSVNLSSAALILCDGIPVSNIQGVNIFDVKSVEVQRGSNMYGLRGGNGVILIRTRDK